MKELVFETEKDFEEFEKEFENESLFEGIMGGLNEILEYKKGNKEVKVLVHRRSLPDVDSSEIRKK